MPTIAPTVGRKVWFWVGAEFGPQPATTNSVLPVDATICNVFPDGGVVLAGFDHYGNPWRSSKDDPIRFADDTVDHAPDEHYSREEGYATWMPFQLGQVKQATAPAERSASEGGA